MTASDSCPTDSALDELINGQLPADEADRLTKHIDSCSLCQQRITNSVNPPNLAAGMLGLRRKTSDSAHLRDAVNRAKHMRGTSESQAVQETDDLNRSTDIDATAFTRDGFELLNTIGRGGMGIVYLAREFSLSRTVAVKVLSPLLASDDSAKTRFLREARSAAAINHPNVITVHAVSDKGPLPYLVMEYVEGVSLQQQLENGGPISIDNVVRIGRQLCAGLAAAHGKGVVHRDIKPGNIFLNSQTGKVLLGDFGLAQAAGNSQLTRTGTIVGTPAFVAPESLIPEGADHRSDLFSLGVVLYAMCVGDSPFQSDSLLATLHRVSSFDPVPLADESPQVPQWLSNVVMRLLTKDPDQRYQSAIEVRDALAAKSAGEPQNAGATVIERSPAKSTYPEIEFSGKQSLSRRNAKRKQQSVQASVFAVAGLSALMVVLLLIYLLGNSASTGQVAEQTKAETQQDSPATAMPSSPEITIGESAAEGKGDFFLIGSAGEVIGRHESFENVLEEAQEDSTIQIRSSDTIEMEQHEIHIDNLTIAAAEGFQPVMKLEASHDGEFDAMLFIESEGVALVGLDLRLPKTDDEEDTTIVNVHEGASLSLRDCRLTAEASGYCLSIETESDVEITRCRLHAPRTAAIGLLDGEGGAISFNDSWITGNRAVFVGNDCRPTLALNNSQFVSDLAFDFEGEEQEEIDPLSLQLNGSLIYVTRGLASIEENMMSAPAMINTIEVSGRGNRFAGSVFAESDPDETQLWREYLQASGSKEVGNPFTIDVAQIREALSASRVPIFEIAQ